MNISINEMTTYRWTFEEDIANYAKAGFSAVGVWRQKLADFGEEKGSELIREAGLKVSSLHWIGGFTGSDGRGYDDSIADAKEAIDIAALLNADCLVAYTGSRGGHTRNHSRRLAKEALTEVCQYAKSQKICVAIEPMHAGCGAEWTFINTLNEALDLIADVGGDELKLVCDAYHLGFCDDALAMLPDVAANTCLVQLGDGFDEPQGEQNRCRLGEGEIPLAEFIAAMRNNGYNGDWEIELLGQDVEQHDYSDLLQHSLDEANRLLN